MEGVWGNREVHPAPTTRSRVKLCMFTPRELTLERGWPGRVDGDRVVQLAAQTLQAFFTGGGRAREHAEYPLADCDLLAPVLYPPAVRVFAPFERGAVPYFSFPSPFPVVGPEQELAYPDGTRRARLRARPRCGDRRGGRDRRVHVANDWTARDLARAEREAGAGPSKSTDFGALAGPAPRHPRRARRDAARRPRERRRALRRRHPRARPPWSDSSPPPRATPRSGPATSCSPESRGGAGPPLQPGDVVELEAEGIGCLGGTESRARRSCVGPSRRRS